MDGRVGHLCRAVCALVAAALEVANRAGHSGSGPLLTVGIQVDSLGEVEALSVDVLCDSCVLPTEPADLVALLTASIAVADASGSSDATPFVATLMRAGVDRLDMHVLSSSPLLSNLQLFVPAGSSDVPVAPVLLPAASVPKPVDMSGGGFRVDLLLARQAPDPAGGSDPCLPGTAMFDALTGILRRTALLLPFCDLSLVLEALGGSATGGIVANQSVHVHRGDQGDTPLPDRLACILDGGAHVAAGSQARVPVIGAVGSATDAVKGVALVWAVDVLLVSQPLLASDTDDPGHAQPQEAAVVLLCQHAVQPFGMSDAMLAALRSKRLATELWTLCGVRISPAAGAHAGIVFKASQAGAPLPHTLVFHITCTPHNKDGTTAWPRRAVAPLSAARRRKMVCAALLGAFHHLKEQCRHAQAPLVGSSHGFPSLASPFEQALRAHGLPAAATAVARILGAGPAAEHLTAALVHRCSPAGARAESGDAVSPAADAAAMQLPPQLSLAQAVTAALLDALDAACCPTAVTATATVAVHAPPIAAEDAAPSIDRGRRRQRENADEMPDSTASPKRHAGVAAARPTQDQAEAAPDSPLQDPWWPTDLTTSPTLTACGDPEPDSEAPMPMSAPIAGDSPQAQTLQDDDDGDWFL
jgi:hypothetical protein